MQIFVQKSKVKSPGKYPNQKSNFNCLRKYFDKQIFVLVERDNVGHNICNPSVSGADHSGWCKNVWLAGMLHVALGAINFIIYRPIRRGSHALKQVKNHSPNT